MTEFSNHHNVDVFSNHHNVDVFFWFLNQFFNSFVYNKT